MRSTLYPTLLLMAFAVAACAPAREADVDAGAADRGAADPEAAAAAPVASGSTGSHGAPPSESIGIGAAEVAAAEAALRPFQQALMGTLTAALAQGPVAAVDACHVEAPQIPGRTAGAGVALGRLSDRLRNPDNRTPAWAEAIWARMQAAPETAAPQTVALENGRIGHLAPIRMAPMCLTCHGSELAPDVASAIDERYPRDAARGYAVGDLRGAFWLTMPRS